MPNALTDSIRKVLRDQGLTFDGTDDSLTEALANVGGPELLQRYPDFHTDWNAIREANSPGTIGGIVNTAKSAFDRSVQAKNVLGRPDEVDVQDIAEREQRIRERPSAPAWEDFQRSDGLDAFKVFLRDPVEITANIVAAGMAGSLPAIGGGLAGGAAGTAVGGPAGGIVGAAVGTGAGSLAVEYGNKYLATLTEAGADLADPESILRVVNDPVIRARAQELGLKRGLPVAAFDAASAGLAGKFLKGVRTATLGQNVRRGLTEAAIQGTLGGGGEIAGALNAGEQISPRAVFEEVVGELGPGGAEVAGAAMRRRLAGGGPVAPSVAETPQNIPQNIPSVATPTPSALPAPPPAVVSPARRVARMSDEEKAARFAELDANVSRTPEEEQELELLRAFVRQAPEALPEAPPPAAPIVPVPPPATLSPAAIGATGAEAPGATPAGVSVAPVAAPTLEQDIARYQEIERLWRAELDRGNADITTEPLKSLFAENEEIKNRHGGMPPVATAAQAVPLSAPAPAVVTDVTPPVFQQPEPTQVPPTPSAPAPVVPATPTPSSPTVAGVGAEQPLVLPTQTSIRETVTPSEDRVIGNNAAGEKLYERADGSIYRMRTDRKDRPSGYPDFGGDLAQVTPALTPEEQANVEKTGTPSPALEQRLAEELAKPEPFLFGSINEGSTHGEGPAKGAPITIDLRSDPRIDSLTPDQVKRLQVSGWGDANSNQSLTRVGIVLEAPDGSYVMTGLLPHQQMAQVGGVGKKDTGPAVQTFGRETRRGGYQKILHEGGNKPALLADVVAAGYKLRAMVHFDTEPTRIWQRWSNAAAYDASYAATPRTTGTQAAKTIPTRSAAEGVGRRNALSESDRLQSQIDALTAELAGADPARAAELNDEISSLYRQMAELPEPRMGTEAPEPPGPGRPVSPLPADADRATDFARVAAYLRQAGMRVDVFARSFLQQELSVEISHRLNALIEIYQNATEEEQARLQPAIEGAQEALLAMDRLRGVTYSPNHISLGLADIQKATLADFVTLLHEAGHALIQGDPAMQARVLRAVAQLQGDLVSENRLRAERTGFDLETRGDPEELVVQTLAQRLTEEGVPEAKSLARAIFQWIKDLYYRLAMAIQEGFGRKPDPQMALDWFENQLRRLVGGDYDYRFASLFDRLAPETPQQGFTRVPGERSGTPEGVTDFYDAVIGQLRQPGSSPETREAVDWNMRFATEEPLNPGKALDIPYREANARTMAAAINEEMELAQSMYDASVAELPAEARPDLEEWWATVGRGDSPALRLAEIAGQFPGAESARIGGERMTEPMNQQARVAAKKLLKSWAAAAAEKNARAIERGSKAEGGLLDEAKALNKIEANLRNADAHEATLRDTFKEMIGAMVKGVRRGIDTAFRAGALAQAVREVENLSEKDPIPKEYQRVFKAVMADEIPLFDYAQSIARLDMPLAEMTRDEIMAGIEANAAADPVLARLLEPRNKPLLVAMAALAKKNAAQMDLIAMRAIRDPAEYLKLKAEMDAIRSAAPDQLRAMERKVKEGRKAATLADRIKQNAITARARLRRMQEAIQESEAAQELLQGARGAIAQKIDAMEVGGMPAPSEWMPYQGAQYLAMNQEEDGTWKSVRRTVDFTPEGPAANPGQLLTDLARNREYLKANEAKRGSTTYELVARQVDQLETIDVTQKVPEIKRWWIEKFLLPSSKLLLSGGGPAAQRALQMLQKFQFIIGGKWHKEIEIPAAHWNSQLRTVTREAGMKDEKAFLNQVYEPVVGLIENEPGLEEGPVLREAVRAAKRRLTTEPTPAFDEALKEFLRQTKAMSEKFVKIARENGIFVEDEKLGELRQAVSRGWMTVMRSMDAATVSTILVEMERAGWNLVFRNAEGGVAVKGFYAGVTDAERVVGTTAFDALMPAESDGPEAAQAKQDVVEDPARFSQAISGFFPPNVVRTWLEPFINKPGEGVFEHNGKTIDPLEVQQAWVESQGDVGRWIDAIGEKIGLEQDIELGEELEMGDVGLEAEWRLSMLRQLEKLFVMESKVAADANQTKGLFDATGRPPHLIMDARENELLPPEHVTHAVFDPMSAKNLLSTLAFHAAFGRNGEGMNRAIAEIEGRLGARVAAFQFVSGQASNRQAREALAKQFGYVWKDLQHAANVNRTVHQGVDALKAQFGFNSAATGLSDIRGGLELLHFIASQAVNNPKTGLLNMLQPMQRALARKSLGATTVRDTSGAYGMVVKGFMGSFLENFGIHILRASRHAANVGAVQGQGFGQVSPTVIADMAATGVRGEKTSLPSRAIRTVLGLQRKGARIGFGESREFPRLNVLPIVGNIMHGIGLTAGIADGATEARTIELLVQAAMAHYAANPQALSDPTSRLTHQDIGAQSAMLRMDKGAYDYLRAKMVEYNIGPLENVARQAMERQTRGEPILTPDQVVKAAQLAAQEVDLQGTINTNPAIWATNHGFRWFTPLMGWPMRQMQQVHEALRTADGRASFLQATKVAGIMAAWSLPFGLAFTFLTDEYDEWILRKKTQLGRVSKLALIPGAAPIALATSDIPVKEHLTAMFQRLSRAGSIYGLGFDAMSSALAGLDPTSGQRPFSMDSRVLAFSQLLNLQQAITNYVNSGFATTYANVGRPLFMALVGSGPLQAVDAIGAALDMDNQEMRIARRTNVNQQLRTAGREIGIELQRGGGASVAPTPSSVWTREMWLAALGGDRLSFLESYRRAVDAAREAGAEDPEKAVRQSWNDRNPLDVFRHRPEPTQLARMLSTMTDNGREAVTSALRQFENFTSLIAPSRAEVYQKQMLGNLRRSLTGPSAETLRRQMSGQSLSAGFR